MKYIRLFEGVEKQQAEVGDYVICHIKDEVHQEETDNFLNNNIGILDNINKGFKNSQGWYVKFKNVPKDIDPYCELALSFDFDKKILRLYDDEIIFFSKNREDCEILLNTKKYNL